ncbi:Cys-Xaa-Xaa-Xaa repeat radical SAM target protein [Syntrophus aciditrophicus]|uniref:Hypothetical cytosolic protein n=1 Tax=Syntrophus aciditrophicus (strain SB) TaxID=56780 RepID=Q2LXD7_SYNAS|nr:Cys-Xaa-Xaa-Xaa repeat radical SAM target protein [Syntrophus aciditrophicus]ABC78743.1 hypothetical cytosolic protein [Syntrophus aciditrophicus SB]OPY14378.1 MAG: hypothetical protein A4E74_02382 [Syntrophus sp. PtaB.Bin075]
MDGEDSFRKKMETVYGKTEKVDRRGFFTTVGKAIIPTLGILGLSLMQLSPKPAAADCADTCSGGCSETCQGCTGCTGSCAGECDRTCRDICANSCTVTAE